MTKNDEYLNLFIFLPVHLPMVSIAGIPTPNRDEFVIVDNSTGSISTILKFKPIPCNSSFAILMFQCLQICIDGATLKDL